MQKEGRGRVCERKVDRSSSFSQHLDLERHAKNSNGPRGKIPETAKVDQRGRRTQEVVSY